MAAVDGEIELQTVPVVERGAFALRASDWLWRPWYAKLWWAAIPIYWLPAGSPFGFDALADFYFDGIGAYLNILFLPVTALVILGFGYARRLRETDRWVEITDCEYNPSSVFYRRTFGSPPVYADPLSPLHDAIWSESPECQARHRGL